LWMFVPFGHLPPPAKVLTQKLFIIEGV
jgi:hypothetical protein